MAVSVEFPERGYGIGSRRRFLSISAATNARKTGTKTRRRAATA
jgi:hypothetical protein